jgi:predicted nucleic acid-binding protein
VAIFVDTGGWYAASVPSDPDYPAASAFLRSNRESLLTTDYIYNELLTLFRSRGHVERARDWVEQGRLGRWTMIRVTDQDIRSATEVFFTFSDKAWSITDCTSRVVMERLGIQRAFAFDDHFRQFGTVAIVP